MGTKLMVMSELLGKFLSFSWRNIENGKLPAAAKAGFFSFLGLLAYMATGYLGNMDARVDRIGARFVKVEEKAEALQKSVEIMTGSIVDLNHKVGVVLATSDAQKKLLDWHSDAISRVETRILQLEKTKEKK